MTQIFFIFNLNEKKPHHPAPFFTPLHPLPQAPFYSPNKASAFTPHCLPALPVSENTR